MAEVVKGGCEALLERIKAAGCELYGVGELWMEFNLYGKARWQSAAWGSGPLCTAHHRVTPRLETAERFATATVTLVLAVGPLIELTGNGTTRRAGGDPWVSPVCIHARMYVAPYLCMQSALSLCSMHAGSNI